MALTNDQYSLSIQIDSHFGFHTAGVNESAQAFTPSVSGDLESVDISVRRIGSPGNLTVAIRAVDGSDQPTGADLAAEVVLEAAVSTSTGLTKLTVTFSTPPTLVGGTTYAIVLRAPSGTLSTDVYDWRSSFNAQDWYPDDASNSFDSGVSWSTIGRDYGFMTRMDIATAQPAPDQFVFGADIGGNPPTIDDAQEQASQTFTPSEDAEIQGVELGLSTNFATGTFDIEIQTVDGANKPSGSVLISKTFNTSDLPTSGPSKFTALFDSTVSLTGGTRYAIVGVFTSATAFDRYVFGHTGSTDQLSGEQFWKSTDDGATWAGDGNTLDMQFATLMVQPVEVTKTIDSDATIFIETTKTIDSDAFIGEETTETIDSDATIEITTTQTLDSDAFIGEETTQTIDSDATVGAETEQDILSDAFVGQETLQTIDSDAVILITTTQTIDSDSVILVTVAQTIDSDANILASTVQTINSKASVSISNQATIGSLAVIVIRQPELKLFSSAAPTVEIGTSSNPIIFSGVLAGEITEHPDNPFFLWNDKDGLLNSVDAREVTVSVLSLNIVDELLGTSTGGVNQTFNVAFPPVVDDVDDHPLTVKVNGVAWTRVSNFVSSGQFDEHYVFDFNAGQVTFGDDINGAIPPISASIEASYTPDDIEFGAEIEEFNWFGVQSLDVIDNDVTVDRERQVSNDANTVQVGHTPVTSVVAVWLDSDPNRLGTEFFAGGSFIADSGVITLGTSLPSANTGVLVDYEYTIEDDLESEFTQIGGNVSHEFPNPIPSNNAKKILIRLVPPVTSSPSGIMNIRFKLKIEIVA